MGECNNRASRIPVDTFAGRIHVEWDPNAEVTPFGQLPLFIEFLKASGLIAHVNGVRPTHITMVSISMVSPYQWCLHINGVRPI
jgi:hypothetical protein